MSCERVKMDSATEIDWMRLKAAELRQLAERNAIVIVPVASVEQHGPHLPVQVDTLLASEIARRAARALAASVPVVVAPAVWSGLAEHHMSFGGTITLDLATFHAILRCVCRSLLRQGFRRVLLLNGHGGNEAALNVIVGELTLELDAPIATVTYWKAAAKPFAEILERQKTVRHACEAETSMMLALVPDLVDIGRLAEAKGPSFPEFDQVVGEGAYRWRSFAARTESGVIGDASLASAAKGERLLDAAATCIAEMIALEAFWTLPR
jgi:creatinine amidohydrolase